MNNLGSQPGNKYINPFEVGTNEYNQSQISPGTGLGIPNSFIDPVAGEFSYAETTNLPNLGFNSAPAEVFNSNRTLAFGLNGQDYLTFNHPPEWYVRETSLKILEDVASGKVEKQRLDFIPEKGIVTEPVELTPKLQLENNQVEQEKDTIHETVSLVKNFLNPVLSVGEKLVKTTFFFTKSLFSLFFEGFLGFGPDNRKPLTKEESAQKEKEVKKTEIKKKFWQDLAQLSKPVPIVGAIKEEMLITNQHNGFYEEYKGVVTNDARITEYHKANRFKKEIENKANQIQAQRSAKMQKAGVGKKPMGMPQQARAGELLMGTENPSHFTKALG